MSPRSRPEPRRLLLEAFAAALVAVEPRAATGRALAQVAAGPCRAIVAGKAAEGMLRALLGSPSHPLVEAVVAAPAPPPPELAADPRLSWHVGGHPLPDAGSLAAGAAVVASIERAPPDARFIVLLSGGASALLEHAAPGVSLDQLRAANAAWLAGGADIAAINRERAALSALKAGGLARRLGPRPFEVLFVSDVPGDDPRVVGSGPCWEARDGGPAPHRCVARNADARAAAAGWAKARGIAVVDHGALSGDATATGRALAAALRDAPAGLHLWGGECTVRLPARPGRGGRCQQLALAAALEGIAPGSALLACGSDGRDGPDRRVAGALVDHATAARASDAGLAPDAALVACDAGTALEAAGDLIDTGPTGTNVADLVFAWRAADER